MTRTHSTGLKLDKGKVAHRSTVYERTMALEKLIEDGLALNVIGEETLCAHIFEISLLDI